MSYCKLVSVVSYPPEVKAALTRASQVLEISTQRILALEAENGELKSLLGGLRKEHEQLQALYRNIESGKTKPDHVDKALSPIRFREAQIDEIIRHASKSQSREASRQSARKSASPYSQQTGGVARSVSTTASPPAQIPFNDQEHRKHERVSPTDSSDSARTAPSPLAERLVDIHAAVNHEVSSQHASPPPVAPMSAHPLVTEPSRSGSGHASPTRAASTANVERPDAAESPVQAQGGQIDHQPDKTPVETTKTVSASPETKRKKRILNAFYTYMKQVLETPYCKPNPTAFINWFFSNQAVREACKYKDAQDTIHQVIPMVFVANNWQLGEKTFGQSTLEGVAEILGMIQRGELPFNAAAETLIGNYIEKFGGNDTTLVTIWLMLQDLAGAAKALLSKESPENKEYWNNRYKFLDVHSRNEELGQDIRSKIVSSLTEHSEKLRHTSIGIRRAHNISGIRYYDASKSPYAGTKKPRSYPKLPLPIALKQVLGK